MSANELAANEHGTECVMYFPQLIGRVLLLAQSIKQTKSFCEGYYPHLHCV